MKRCLCFLLAWSVVLSAAALAQTAPSTPQDTLTMTNGERRTGRLTGLDAQGFSLEVPVGTGQGAGTIRVPRNVVAQVDFAPDATRDALIGGATAAQLPALTALWERTEAYLSVPRSPSARLGLRLGDLWLESRNPEHATKAAALFARIEKEAWDPDDRAAARLGRLRGMAASGKMEEAAAEAREMLKAGLSPEVTTEARYIVARASEELLRKLLEENPRWEEDDRVRPERARLLNDALDGYLYPSLFAGVVAEPAARGLQAAIGVYQLIQEPALAVEAARDIVALYPGTRFLKPAQEFLTGQARNKPGADNTSEPSFAAPAASTHTNESKK